jgi:hypothetical protein
VGIKTRALHSLVKHSTLSYIPSSQKLNIWIIGLSEREINKQDKNIKEIIYFSQKTNDQYCKGSLNTPCWKMWAPNWPCGEEWSGQEILYCQVGERERERGAGA